LGDINPIKTKEKESNITNSSQIYYNPLRFCGLKSWDNILLVQRAFAFVSNWLAFFFGSQVPIAKANFWPYAAIEINSFLLNPMIKFLGDQQPKSSDYHGGKKSDSRRFSVILGDSRRWCLQKI
jgi:hypothetical protein